QGPGHHGHAGVPGAHRAVVVTGSFGWPRREDLGSEFVAGLLGGLESVVHLGRKGSACRSDLTGSLDGEGGRDSSKDWPASITYGPASSKYRAHPRGNLETSH